MTDGAVPTGTDESRWASDDDSYGAIAVIGAACRMPGAATPEAFWQRLFEGREFIRAFAADELEAAGIDAVTAARPDHVARAAVLEDVFHFDPELFGYSDHEALEIDPQQRLFLLCAHEALERAGYGRHAAGSSIGVFGSAKMSTYVRPDRHMLLNIAAPRTFQTLLGNDKDYLATRVAYKLDLRGPAYTVQTACSSSLVAVHLACEHLRNGDCDMALAGGVGIALPQTLGYLHRDGMIFSPDGRCRPFDEAADGTGVGHGAGVVLLKRLEDARTDGDEIWGVVRSSAINNDGAAKVGFTAPNAQSQAAVIAEALAMADVDPSTIGLVEAHATGTPLGDPIEVAALTRVYRRYTDKRGYCALGSVKSNLGHLDTAAGIASFLKVLLALRNEAIPPTLNVDRPNPALGLDASPFYLPAYAVPWEGPAPRRAACSSFGIGGTNCHVVLEAAPPAATERDDRPSEPVVLPLSARSITGLERYAGQIREAVEESAYPLRDVAATLAHTREAHPFRAYAVFDPGQRPRVDDWSRLPCLARLTTGAEPTVRLAGARNEAAAAWLRAAADGADDPFHLAPSLPAAPPALRRWLEQAGAPEELPPSGAWLALAALGRWLKSMLGDATAIEAAPGSEPVLALIAPLATDASLIAELARLDDVPAARETSWPCWPVDEAILVGVYEPRPYLVRRATEAALWQAGLADCPFPPLARRVALPAVPFETRHLARTEAPARDDGADAAWTALLARGRDVAERLAHTVDLSPVEDERTTVALLHRFYTSRAMMALGGLADGGWHSLDEIMVRGGIEPRFHQLVGRLLEDLVGEQGLARDGTGRYGRLVPTTIEEAAETERRLDGLAAIGDVGLARLIARTAPNLAEMLAGRIDPVELVFPQSDFSDAEELYERHRYGRYFNGLMGAIAGGFATAAAGPVRVIEIGAGTGGTTSSVLEALGDRLQRYVFTDIGPSFLQRARRKFDGERAMDYAVLDMERDVGAQGFDIGAFDVVVAANVLHNGRRLEWTLGNVRRLLKPGGILLVREIVEPKPLFDIVFGALAPEIDATDGRDGNLFASRDLWKDAAVAAGFSDVAAFPDAALPASVLGEAVMVFRNPADMSVAATAAPRHRVVWQADARAADDRVRVLALLVDAACEAGLLPGTLHRLALRPCQAVDGSVALELGDDDRTLTLRRAVGSEQQVLASATLDKRVPAPPAIRAAATTAPADLEAALRLVLDDDVGDVTLALSALAAPSSLRLATTGTGGSALVTAGAHYPVVWPIQADGARLVLPAADGPTAARLFVARWHAVATAPDREDRRPLCMVAATGDTAAAALASSIARHGGAGRRIDPRIEPLDVRGDETILFCANGLLGSADRDLPERLAPLHTAFAALARALQADRSPRTLVVVTHGAGAVDATDEMAEPMARAALAIGAVAARELPKTSVIMVDTDDAAASLDAVVLLPRLADGDGATFAVRRGQVFRRSFKALPAAAPAALFLPAGSTVVITGGLSRLGRTLLSWLGAIGVARAHLVLHRQPTSEEAQDLRDIAAATGIAIGWQDGVDCADAAAVTTAFDDLARSGVTVGLVLHLAGVVRDGSLDRQSWAEARNVFAVKIAAAEAMIRALPQWPAAKLVLFSSLAASLGPRGQAAHAAACAVLEAMAERARADGLDVQAIGWDYWREALRPEHEGLAAQFRTQGLATADGLALLATAMVQRRASLIAAATAAFEAPATEPTGHGATASASSTADGRDPLPWLVKAVAELVGRAPHQIDTARGLIQLGVDSLMFIDLRERVQAELGIELTAEVALGAESLEQLAKALVETPLAAAPS